MVAFDKETVREHGSGTAQHMPQYDFNTVGQFEVVAPDVMPVSGSGHRIRQIQLDFGILKIIPKT